MRVPVAVWQPCELLYTRYLLTCSPPAQRGTARAAESVGGRVCVSVWLFTCRRDRWSDAMCLYSLPDRTARRRDMYLPVLCTHRRDSVPVQRPLHDALRVGGHQLSK